MDTNLKIPQTMQPYFDSIRDLIESFCKQLLDDECTNLAKSILAALCRKRPSPLLSGSRCVWAASIIYALGQVNFLFDKMHTPYMQHADICDWFKVSQSTVGNKAKSIRDMLKMDYYNHQWILRSRMEKTSFVWMVDYKGFVVDARTLPLEVQIIAWQKDMIPYVPFLEDI